MALTISRFIGTSMRVIKAKSTGFGNNKKTLSTGYHFPRGESYKQVIISLLISYNI
jgi:hypothetical protein